MNNLKKIFASTALSIIILILTPLSAKALSTPPDNQLAINGLDIKSEIECLSLGGTWDSCPPNDCQKSAAYKNGEVICPQVCGAPECAGIVPQESQDFSSVQNPFVDQTATQKTPTNLDQIQPTGEIIDGQSGTPTTPELTAGTQSSLPDSQLAILLGLGLAGILIYLWIQHKIRSQQKNSPTKK